MQPWTMASSSTTTSDPIWVGKVGSMWTEIAWPKRTWSPTVIRSWSPRSTVRAPILTPRPRVTLPITNPSASISTSSPTVGSVPRYGSSGITVSFIREMRALTPDPSPLRGEGDG